MGKPPSPRGSHGDAHHPRSSWSIQRQAAGCPELSSGVGTPLPGLPRPGLWGSILTSVCRPFWEPVLCLAPSFSILRIILPKALILFLPGEATSYGSYSPHFPSPWAAHPSIIQSSGLNEYPCSMSSPHQGCRSSGGMGKPLICPSLRAGLGLISPAPGIAPGPDGGTVHFPVTHPQRNGQTPTWVGAGGSPPLGSSQPGWVAVR